MRGICIQRGGGATLNGKRVRVAGAKKVTEALIVNNMGSSRDPAVNVMTTERLLALLQSSVRGLRNSGSAAQNMMDVACGKLDAYFEDGFGGPWDVAAGHVIVQEAGGVCRHHLGGPVVLMAGKGQVLCGNAEVVEDIARVLNTVQPSATKDPTATTAFDVLLGAALLAFGIAILLLACGTFDEYFHPPPATPQPARLRIFGLQLPF